jgi:hypothetical protein
MREVSHCRFPIADCRLEDCRMAIVDLGIADWRLLIGDCGLPIDDLAQSPIVNRQSSTASIVNRQSCQSSIANRQSSNRQSAIGTRQSRCPRGAAYLLSSS